MENIIRRFSEEGGIYRFMRFCIVGAINTGIDTFVFFICYYYLHAYLSLSQVLGYSSGMVSSYLLNSLFTFKNKELKSVRKIIGFLVVNSLSLACSILALELAMKITKLLILSKLIAVIASLVTNFIGQKKIFIKKGDTNDKKI